MLSQIVIEAEGLGNSQTLWRLSVDTHLIAENLTITQAKHLIGEILDRIAVFETLEDGEED
jgi:hypothetical protein